MWDFEIKFLGFAVPTGSKGNLDFQVAIDHSSGIAADSAGSLTGTSPFQGFELPLMQRANQEPSLQSPRP